MENTNITQGFFTWKPKPGKPAYFILFIIVLQCLQYKIHIGANSIQNPNPMTWISPNPNSLTGNRKPSAKKPCAEKPPKYNVVPKNVVPMQKLFFRGCYPQTPARSNTTTCANNITHTQQNMAEGGPHWILDVVQGRVECWAQKHCYPQPWW